MQRAASVERHGGHAAVEHAGHDLFAVDHQLSALRRQRLAVDHSTAAITLDDVTESRDVMDDLIECRGGSAAE